MEKKAQLFEKLARGKNPYEEIEERYCVDFSRKGIEHEEDSQTSMTSISFISAPPKNLKVDAGDDGSLFSN